jgi:hypothetical protein
LIGLGAWLLGAVTATTGSMIAVSELANGLLGTQSQQLGGATANADLTVGSDSPSPAAALAASASASASHRPARVRHSASPSPSAAAQSPAGTLLESGDGSVMASCQSGAAYLLYWSPDQGFQAEDVTRGPAAITSVTFRGPAGSVVVRVSCSAGTPVAHLYQPSGDDSGGGGGE